MQAFIPRKLNDVVDFERDLERVREGIDTDLVCHQFLCLMTTVCHETNQCTSLFHCGF